MQEINNDKKSATQSSVLVKQHAAPSRDDVKSPFDVFFEGKANTTGHTCHTLPPTSKNVTSAKFSGSMRVSITTAATTEFPICCVVYF